MNGGETCLSDSAHLDVGAGANAVVGKPTAHACQRQSEAER
ncbi:MAG TPA: hypothetical protein PK586_01215 [Casimicrobium sp.]|nr:hypothetical protein [Casimicrobium sp.]